ncbi:MAG: MFS transporter [Alphaproteobacteria bacterium]|nr:MFS transporter [Alphaproteobacteria bacterium]
MASAATAPVSARARAAWCLYDWANSPFPTVVVTFVFAAYVTRGIVGDEVRGTALWAHMLSLSGLAIALLGPVVGAIGDAGGRIKSWLFVFTGATIVAGGSLWFAAPDPDNTLWVMAVVGLGNVAFEIASVFYNAMLPRIAQPGRVGRLSGWGWALGYAGGLACLSLALVGLIQADPPPFGLDPAEAEPVRAVGPLVALWLLLFGWPLFVFMPDVARKATTSVQAVGGGLRQLARTVRAVRHYPNIAWFLGAKMLYIDGLNTIFGLGGIYAAIRFDMAIDEILLFGIALNVTAAAGALTFAWVDDWAGPKRTLVVGNLGLLATSAAILLAESKLGFWIGGLALGCFIGPVQSSSRSMMARLAPRGMEAEMFGLYAFSGKATAFLGPAVVGWVTLATASPRIGMAAILPFFALGLALLTRVRTAPTLP